MSLENSTNRLARNQPTGNNPNVSGPGTGSLASNHRLAQSLYQSVGWTTVLLRCATLPLCCAGAPPRCKIAVRRSDFHPAGAQSQFGSRVSHHGDERLHRCGENCSSTVGISTGKVRYSTCALKTTYNTPNNTNTRHEHSSDKHIPVYHL